MKQSRKELELKKNGLIMNVQAVFNKGSSNSSGNQSLVMMGDVVGIEEEKKENAITM